MVQTCGFRVNNSYYLTNNKNKKSSKKPCRGGNFILMMIFLEMLFSLRVMPQWVKHRSLQELVCDSSSACQQYQALSTTKLSYLILKSPRGSYVLFMGLCDEPQRLQYLVSFSLTSVLSLPPDFPQVTAFLWKLCFLGWAVHGQGIQHHDSRS